MAIQKIIFTPTMLIFMSIMALAAILRLWNLPELPPGLYPDEAAYAMDAVRTFETGNREVFYPANNGREGLFINIVALSFSLFGVGVWQFKIISAVAGILTVLWTYLFSLELFGEKKRGYLIAFASSFFIAVSFWHLHFSRMGFRAITMPLISVMAFYFLIRILNHKRLIDFMLGGAFFALGFYTYLSFRVAIVLPILIGLFELTLYLKRKKLKLNTKWFKKMAIDDGWWKWALYTGAAIIVILPLLFYFIGHPEDIGSRSSGISIFAKEEPIKEFAISTVKTFAMFHIKGDSNPRHNIPGWPQLLFPVGILFVLGMGKVAKELFLYLKKVAKPARPGQKRFAYSPLHTGYVLLFAWFFAMLLPAMLTAEGIPHALRTIGAIVPAYIFAGIGFEVSYERMKNRFRPLLIGAFVCAITIFSVYQYFFQWAQNPELPAAFSQKLVRIGAYMNDQTSGADKRFVIDEDGPWEPGNSIAIQTVRFINYKTRNITYIKKSDIADIPLYPQERAVFIPLRDEEEVVRLLETRFEGNAVVKKDEELTIISVVE